LEHGSERGNGKEKTSDSAVVCRALIKISRDTSIPFNEIWRTLTRSQLPMVMAAIQANEDHAKHDDAVITHAAVNAAIVASFGKDKGGFRRFLKQFKDSDEGKVPATTPLPEMKQTPQLETLEGWTDF
jgi:hypothetical protein